MKVPSGIGIGPDKEIILIIPNLNDQIQIATLKLRIKDQVIPRKANLLPLIDIVHYYAVRRYLHEQSLTPFLSDLVADQRTASEQVDVPELRVVYLALDLELGLSDAAELDVQVGFVWRLVVAVVGHHLQLLQAEALLFVHYIYYMLGVYPVHRLLTGCQPIWLPYRHMKYPYDSLK